ncbi:pentapeptide repeat-containing protein [Sphingomonas beigongshangi]|uniref:pentapeptide repeat-containing protein n=1 Tax=Sphingomonas beigongshangi TaxID=2782540 RepID=UPI00193C218E|nr:pentapeptide repeat-containing protein [Sphingomonas beigongshangi]
MELSSLQRVLAIAESGETNLVSLAKMTEFDQYRFYEGADLTGIDVSGQDVSGLSFFGANLTGANLSDILFSPGAFNGATVDAQYSALKDSFEFRISEVTDGYLQRIHLYATFRPGYIESVLSYLSVTYDNMANQCEISTSTLRKARRGELVSMETVKNISNGILLIVRDRGADYPIDESIYMNPVIKFVFIYANGTRRYVNRQETKWLIEMARRLDVQSGRYSVRSKYNWRDTPHILAWLAAARDLFEPGDEEMEAFAMAIKSINYVSDEEMERIMASLPDAGDII